MMRLEPGEEQRALLDSGFPETQESMHLVNVTTYRMAILDELYLVARSADESAASRSLAFVRRLDHEGDYATSQDFALNVTGRTYAQGFKEWLLLEQKIISAVSAAHRILIMAKKRKTQSSSVSLLDPSSLKTFFNTPAGRQLMADIVMAAAGVAAAALLASNRGGKAMGKAAMGKAQEAVMGVISTALSGKR